MSWPFWHLLGSGYTLTLTTNPIEMRIVGTCKVGIIKFNPYKQIALITEQQHHSDIAMYPWHNYHTLAVSSANVQLGTVELEPLLDNHSLKHENVTPTKHVHYQRQGAEIARHLSMLRCHTSFMLLGTTQFAQENTILSVYREALIN